MKAQELSKITCAVDANLAPLVDAALADLGLPEAFLQRGKQDFLQERSGWLGLRARTASAEARAWMYRFYVPRRQESNVMRRVAEAADLYLPGRGSIYAENATLFLREELAFDESLIGAPGKAGNDLSSKHSVLCCIVQRGMSEPLARTVLEMGLCVPFVSFGKGMGLRNKLGLLRVTIPVDKEVVYFVVPEHDADLLEGVAVHKERLDRPGQGFIYRCPVRALSVNLRVRQGGRRYAASMEQVIAALDEMRGSAEWRRLTPAASSRRGAAKAHSDLVCLSLIAEEGRVGEYVRLAMEAGAGGATLVPLERRCCAYGASARGAAGASHAREGCDLIIPTALTKAVLDAVEAESFFSEPSAGIAEVTAVQRAVTYAG